MNPQELIDKLKSSPESEWLIIVNKFALEQYTEGISDGHVAVDRAWRNINKVENQKTLSK
jgi:hypothetical protein